LDVGERLQSIRKLKGLSQRELAKRAGVTNSTISMIEKLSDHMRQVKDNQIT